MIPALNKPYQPSELVNLINTLINQINGANSGTYSGGTAGGAATALTLAIANYSPSIGNLISFFPSNISVGPGVTTVSINGSATVPIKKISVVGLVDISDGDFFPGVPIILSFDGTEYIALNVVYNGVYSSKATGFTLSLADLFNSVTCTASFSITLSAASTYANYFYCNIVATSGNITLVPNGMDKINGSNSNFTINSGTRVRLYTDGLSLWQAY